MLINNKSAEERLKSPNNLFNKLRSAASQQGKNRNVMGLFGVGRKEEGELRSGTKEVNGIKLPVFESKSEVKIPEVLPALNQPASGLNSPTIDDLVNNPENNIKLEAVHDKALTTLHAAMNEINRRLPEVNKVKDLADIAAKMNKVVTDIRAEKSKRNDNIESVHLHFYTPERKKLTDYQEVTTPG